MDISLYDMDRKYRVYYDKRFDRLMVAGKTDSDVSAGSIRVLNVILDFNTQNKVINAELLRASEYLEMIGMSSAILEKIEGGKLLFRAIRGGYEIAFVLIVNRKSIVVPYNVQIPSNKQIEIRN